MAVFAATPGRLNGWYRRFLEEHVARRVVAWLSSLMLPLAGIAVFLLIWQFTASHIHTSLGQFPGPVEVMQQGENLYQEGLRERRREAAFNKRQRERIAKRVAADPGYKPHWHDYPGNPTFFDQIVTSLTTVAAGFALATIIAVPLGIAFGLSSRLYAAANPLVQLFKPVSPLAWLPLVTIVVTALYTTSDPAVPKAFLVSMITVTLCSLWPTLINTAVGVASVDDDLVNVSRVLRLGWFSHVRRIVLPSSIPMIFTGLRLSLGIAWMVLIAAEMLAQNPGLGKFVWDEFQNGSSESLSRIMFAVIVIGAIGFFLDRGMLWLQTLVSWDSSKEIR